MLVRPVGDRLLGSLRQEQTGSALQDQVTQLFEESRDDVYRYLLTLGLHLERDLPRLIDRIAAAHPGLDVRVTPPLDGHPALVEALLDRAKP